MVTALVRHTAKWTAPSPFWNADLKAGLEKKNGSPWQPAILRFDNDLFMDETLSLLAYRPEGLTERIALPETWMKPMKRPVTISRADAAEPVSEFRKKIKRQDAKNHLPGNASGKTEEAEAGKSAEDEEIPLKLYQPAHKRFYLVAASLVCQQAGMPDRRIDAGKREAAEFVVRRVAYKDTNQESRKDYEASDDQWSEYAFVATEDGFAWKMISPEYRERIQDGEERLSLFAMHFNDLQGQRRRMLAGLVPVGRREEYLHAPELANGGQPAAGEQQTSLDPRRLVFEAKVIGPWTALIQQASVSRNGIIDAPNQFQGIKMPDDAATKQADERKKILKTLRNQIQTISWYTLLDFAEYLQKYLNPVWQVIIEEKNEGELKTEEQKNLYSALKNISVQYGLINEDYTSGSPTDYYYHKQRETKLTGALRAIVDSKSFLEKTTEEYNVDTSGTQWPQFTFPLTDPGYKWLYQGPVPNLSIDESDLKDWEVAIDKVAALGDLVEKALEPSSNSLPDLQSPQQALGAGDGWFIIRCVYERPNCGPLNPAVLSAPTEKFLMAPFFDPEAPARPVRISLPLDISPAGLRKFKKNATLVMSDMLCGKVKEIRQLTFGDLVLSVLPWPFHKDLPEPDKTGPCTAKDASMYCSLSIPIVTLVALILMIIMVALFDYFFKWIPYLFTCFPIPGMKGKKA